MGLKTAILLFQIFTLSKHVYGINQESFFDNESKEYTIKFGNAPMVNGPVQTYITINEGDVVTIECKVDGDINYILTWYKVINEIIIVSCIK